MARVRAALLAVSAVLLVLVAALAWRAHEGRLAERALRHRAVAERAFEEMERALGDWLAREEARPVEHYALRLPGTGERSPLAGPLEPFVVGAFTQQADGALVALLDPADRQAAARVARTVASLWSKPPADDRDEADAARERQAPGTTRALAGPGVDAAEPSAPAEALAKKESSSAYDVLQSLNRAGAERAERKQKQVVALAPRAERELALEESAELRDDFAAAPAPEPAPAASPVAPARRAVRFTVDPMLGVAVGADALVLYRTVLGAGRAHRQGLVLDRQRLGAWLEERVIAGSALAPLSQLRFDAAASAPPPDQARYLFAHRFAEPFDALHAELALAALPGEGSPAALAALVGLLLAVGAAGLFAVHRTAAVVVDYAERRGNFVASVTHELKTPLTAIRMYAEMLRDGLVPDEAKRREYYGTITDESERLSRLVDNVLEFSRLEGGRRELRLEVGDVAPVLREAVDKLAAHAEREGFELALALPPALPAVRFDRDALMQVLYNLVDNAMKYARGASRRIVFEASEERGGVRVAVRDFGPGVARGQLEHVFEPFYRAESELTRSAKGTGIGLALVKELGERMGAAVSAVNAEGGGLRVGLVFPATQQGGAP